MGNLLQTIIRNSFFAAFGKLGVKAISFVFTIFIIRQLGDEGYGQYTLIWSYVTIFAMLSDAGLGMYIIREVAKQKTDSQDTVGNIIILRLLLALFTVALIVVTAWLLDYSVQFLQYVFLASLILLLYAIQDPLDSVLQAQERFDLAAAAIIGGQLVFVGVGTLLLLTGWHITGLIIAALVNVLVSTVLAWYLMVDDYRLLYRWQIKPRLWLGFIRASFSFGLIKLWLSWSWKISTIILAWFWMDQMVGWYGAAYAIITGILFISSSINTAFYPTLSRQYSQHLASIPKISILTLKYLLIISLPIAGGVFLTAGKWINLLYGPEFAPATVALSVLILAVPLNFVSEFYRYTLLATNRERIAAQTLGWVVLFSLGLNLWLIPPYGYLGAALVVIVTETSLVFLYTWHLRNELNSLPITEIFFKPIASTLVLMSVVYFTSSFPLFLQFVLGGIAFIVSLWALRAFNSDEYRALFSGLLKPVGLNSRAFQMKKAVNKPAPFVNVFIPAYNAGQFLAQAIESVLNQTYKNYELIIIDDGSTDNTARLLIQYESHPKISIYHNLKNLGMAPTWNVGLSKCRGKFVAKLDADDFYEPEYLETVIEIFEERRDVGLVFSGLNLVYPDGRVETEMKFLRSWVQDREIFLPTLLQLCVIRSPTVCVRRDCYDQLGNFIEEMRIHADWEMWVRIAANCSVGYIARRLANYRTNYGTNVTSRAAADGRSMHDLQLWLNLLERNALPYRLTDKEKQLFRWGIYELEMHFAAMAAHAEHRSMQDAYIAFAEEILSSALPASEMKRMRQVYLNLHLGVCAFQSKKLTLARNHFIHAIKAGPRYCTSTWIWNKLLLTFTGRTKWGFLNK